MENKKAVYAGPAGQDLGELFATCLPPTEPQIKTEFVDEVTLTGEMLSRKEVHTDGHWHRAVHVWVYNPIDQTILIQLRTEHKDTNPGCWDVSSAGHITGMDGPVETAEREAEEEIGLTVKNQLEHLFTVIACDEGETKNHGKWICKEYQYVYLVSRTDLGDGSTLELSESEVAGVKFIDVGEFRKLLEARDPKYVPRSPKYIQKFFAILEAKKNL